LIALGITCTALSIVLGGLGAIARILWKDTGIGLKWAVVQFPAGGGGGGQRAIYSASGSCFAQCCCTPKYIARRSSSLRPLDPDGR
jgi:hypothetical protein